MNEFARSQKQYREKAKKREGEVTIDYNPGSQSKTHPSRGEYVDYVEVKD